jgi:hypothetical protein
MHLLLITKIREINTDQSGHKILISDIRLKEIINRFDY